VRDIYVFVPSLLVQDAIVNEVEEHRPDSALLRSAIERQLSLLSERRRAMITAAVTREIDPSEVAAGTPAASRKE